MKTVNIEQIEKVKIYNSDTVLSKEDVKNMVVDISEEELCNAVTTFYVGKYHNLINKIFNNELYESYNNDTEKLVITVLNNILKTPTDYMFTKSEQYLIKSVIELFKERIYNY